MGAISNSSPRKAWALIFNVALLAGLFVIFQNCSGENIEVDESAALTDRPEKVCGEQGYRYLLDTYFIQYCAGCHSVGGFSFPPFADHDLSNSFKYALSIPKETFIKFSTDNQFCLEEACELKPGEPRYNALVEWLDNRKTCN